MQVLFQYTQNWIFFSLRYVCDWKSVTPEGKCLSVAGLAEEGQTYRPVLGMSLT